MWYGIYLSGVVVDSGNYTRSCFDPRRPIRTVQYVLWRGGLLPSRTPHHLANVSHAPAQYSTYILSIAFRARSAKCATTIQERIDSWRAEKRKERSEGNDRDRHKLDDAEVKELISKMGGDLVWDPPRPRTCTSDRPEKMTSLA